MFGVAWYALALSCQVVHGLPGQGMVRAFWTVRQSVVWNAMAYRGMAGFGTSGSDEVGLGMQRSGPVRFGAEMPGMVRRDPAS